MSLSIVVRSLFCFFLILSNQAVMAGEQNSIDLITENITKVCDKPDHAGTYWDIKVKGNGEAGIRLKLLGLGKVSGESTFSKGEWEGVQRTVEDSKNYRDCVKELAPVFLEKFSSLLVPETEKKKRTLGGVQWQEFGGGVELTLKSCYRKSGSIVCELIAHATQRDVKPFIIYGESAIYDQNGNKYMASFSSISNFQNSFNRTSSSVRGELVKGVDTDVLIRFMDDDENIESISKVFVKAYVKNRNGSNYQDFSFRNVFLQIDQE